MSYMDNRFNKNAVKKFNGLKYRLTYKSTRKKEVQEYANLRKKDNKNNRYRIIKKGKTYWFYETKKKGRNKNARKRKK